MRGLLTSLIALSLVAFGASACSSGSSNDAPGGDQPPVGSSLDVTPDKNIGNQNSGSDDTNAGGDSGEADPSESVDGTIKGLQLASEAAGCSEDQGFPETILEQVSIANAIVTSPRFVAYENSEGVVELHGYYVCDGDQSEWSGVMVTIPALENTNFVPGDSLTLVGNLEEAWCNTQLSVESNGYELSGSSEVPEALAVDAAAESFEPYEGMFISLSNVLVESETSWGGYTLEGGLEVSYGFEFFLSMEVGKRYDISGQLRYAYGAYQLLPRYETDFNLTGEGGDPGTPVDPIDADDLDGSIAALQTLAESQACDEDASFPATLVESAQVEAAVVTSPRFEVSAGLHGYYVWDNTGALWSGILMTIPEDENTNFAPGDTLTLSGELQDAWCNTQFKVASGGWELTGSTELAGPIAVDSGVNDFEPYEGTLVTLTNILVKADAGGGRYTLENDMEVDHDFDFFLSMEVGKRYDVTGQVKYGYSTYKVMPRFESDLIMLEGGETVDPEPNPEPEPGTTMTISDIQQGSDSLTCADSGNIVTIQDSVTVEGVVSVPSFEVHDTLNGYVLSDGSAELYSGLVIVVPKELDEAWEIGQTLKVTGSYIEFYCLSELSVTSIEALEMSDADLSPIAVSDFAENAEAYEGMLITVSDATVTSIENVESYGEIETDGGFILDDWITGKEVITTPEVGATYCSVTGVATFNFGTYRLNPRSASDLVLCD